VVAKEPRVAHKKESSSYAKAKPTFSKSEKQKK